MNNIGTATGYRLDDR